MDFFSKVSLTNPRRILSALEKNKAQESDPLEIKVGLNTGHELAGKFITFDERPGQGGLALAVFDPGTKHSVSLSFVNLDAIAFVTIPSPELLSALLTEGRVDSLALREGPSRLELSRRLEALGKNLRTNYKVNLSLAFEWPASGENQFQRNIFDETLKDLERTLRPLLSEDFSRQEIEKRITKIEVGFGPSRAVNVKNETLYLLVSTEGGTHGRFSFHELSQEINKLL